MNRWLSVRAKAYSVRRDIEAKIGQELYGNDLLGAILAEEGIWLVPVPANDPLLGGEGEKYCQATYSPGNSGYSIITVNQEASPHQYVLYIAHETGHHFLHTRFDSCTDDDVNPQRVVLTVPYAEGRVATYNPYQLQEQEANIFAAELLIPSQRLAEKFDNGMGVDDLADFFKVSKYSILAQLVNAVLEPAIDFEHHILQEKNPPFRWGDLDSSQKDAACTTVGPVRVDAGPGTGKTRTLTSRIEWLIENKTAPEKIIALTFSNKATDELRQRIRTTLPTQAHQVTVSTFHGFGVELLRRYGTYCDIKPDFTILDQIDAETLLTEHLDQLDLKHFTDPVNPDKYLAEGTFGGSILGFISRIKQELITPEEFSTFIDKIANDLDAESIEKYREIAYVYHQYEQLKRAANVVDYDDLVVLPVLIMNNNLPQKTELQALYQHVLVDEFQDINRANGELVRILAGEGQGLWVVGDLRQSIYRWRGASPTYLRDFQKHYPQAETKYLRINYRATSKLVDYVNTCTSSLALSKDPEKWVSNVGNSEDSEIQLIAASTRYHEHIGIIKRIKRLMVQQNYSYGDFAILCRTRRIACEFAEALQRADIPVLHFGDFYERPEVKDILAVVDLVANSHGVSWVRVAQNLTEPIIRQQSLELWQQARTNELLFPDALNIIADSSGLSISQSEEIRHLAELLSKYKHPSLANPWLIMAEFIFAHGNYLRRLRTDVQKNMPKLLAIGQLMNLARSHSQRKPLAFNHSKADSFLHYIRSLLSREDEEISNPAVSYGIDAVRILTIHKSKGLEFPVIFVPRIDKVTFPPRGSRPIMPIPKGLLSDVEEDTDSEEKSGLFVAISRSRNHLILSYARQQDNGNKRNPSDYWQHLNQPFVTETSWDDFEIDNIAPTDWNEGISIDDSDEISVSAMRRLEYCPRQFFYQDVLQMKVSTKGDIYLDFHTAISKTIEWIQERIESNQSIDHHAVESEFITQFNKYTPEAHSHRKWYESEGKKQIIWLLDGMLSRRQIGEVVYNKKISSNIAGIRFAVTIDEISKTADETQVVHHRIAKASKGNLRMHLYRQALQNSSDQVYKFVTHSLFDKQTNESMPSDESEKAKKIQKHIEYIKQSKYPAEPIGKWVCASCPFFYICPQ